MAIFAVDHIGVALVRLPASVGLQVYWETKMRAGVFSTTEYFPLHSIELWACSSSIFLQVICKELVAWPSLFVFVEKVPTVTPNHPNVHQLNRLGIQIGTRIQRTYFSCNSGIASSSNWERLQICVARWPYQSSSKCFLFIRGIDPILKGKKLECIAAARQVATASVGGEKFNTHFEKAILQQLQLVPLV